MARLSVSVMAHSKRAHLIPDLCDRLGISEDQVVWDRRSDRWDTGRRAWEAHDPTATHHLVLQDDALVCADLIPGLEKALEHVPDDALVSPYVGTRRPVAAKVERVVDQARLLGSSWIVMGSLNWGVGIIAPVGIIGDMLPWCDLEDYPNYDRRIGQYALRELKWPTWCTWPSLVDHRDEVESLCGHGVGRTAHEFIGPDASALSVDWGRGHVVMNTGPPTPEELRARKLVWRGGVRTIPRGQMTVGTPTQEHSMDETTHSYKDMSATELRDACRRRGLAVSGTKTELAARLVEADAAVPVVEERTATPGEVLPDADLAGYTEDSVPLEAPPVVFPEPSKPDAGEVRVFEVTVPAVRPEFVNQAWLDKTAKQVLRRALSAGEVPCGDVQHVATVAGGKQFVFRVPVR